MGGVGGIGVDAGTEVKPVRQVRNSIWEACNKTCSQGGEDYLSTCATGRGSRLYVRWTALSSFQGSI
jgi:hypothetical protein